MRLHNTWILGSALASILATPLAFATSYGSDSIPSVIVTVENSAPSRGAFQTPFWVGIHDGTFDIYDRDAPLGANETVPPPAVERLAEDGNTGPISEAFTINQGLSPQATLAGPSGPLAPGDRASYTLNVDPSKDRYFSYASMLIPSNDAFIANGNPLAHQLFNKGGRFVGRNFVVAGTEVLDAGTEVNDEISGNTAFLNQGGPDIGAPEAGSVVIHPGLAQPGALIFPDGVLNHPVFGLADFTQPTYRAATIKFRYVDLARKQLYASRLSASQEVTGNAVESNGFGRAWAVSKRGEFVYLRIYFNRLTGPLVAAHLHNAQAGANGPVVVDLGSDVSGSYIQSVIDASRVVGPLSSAEDPALALINELAAGNIYINLHTEANPGGELRGQLSLR